MRFFAFFCLILVDKNTLFAQKTFDKINKIMPKLSPSSTMWWSNNAELIELGIINCGRFEKFTRRFARYILPLIHSKKNILKFLTFEEIDKQWNFYNSVWNSKIWKFLFNLASHRLTLKKFARQEVMFNQITNQTLSDLYLIRLEKKIRSTLIKGNPFLQYSLTGKYVNTLPEYMKNESYLILNKIPDTILSLENNDLLSYLRTVPDNTFTKYNLSDIFEALSSVENDIMWGEIIRTAKNNAVVAYWNNLIIRTCPSNLSKNVVIDENLVVSLNKKDKVFFYNNFQVNTIKK